jgi:endonuclease/exonuclease/phosphatase family metal-dependent hydrolase
VAASAVLWAVAACAPAPTSTAGGASPPGAAAAPAAPAPPRALRIATWNIAWLSDRDGEGEIPRRAGDYARLRDYAARLDADIVAVQEVENEAAVLRVFDPAVYRCHLTGDLDNPQRTGFVYRRDLDVVTFPDAIGLAVERKRRGADIGVRLGGGELRLLSVHLKSGCWTAPLETDSEACAILRAQLPALQAWIDARARDGTPFAVVGDFNRRFTPADPFWTAIDDGEPHEARLTDAARGMRSRCWGGEYPALIDHIVLSRQVAHWIIPGSVEQVVFEDADLPHKRTLSDHCPLAVTLDIGGRGGQDAAARQRGTAIPPSGGAAPGAGSALRLPLATPGPPTYAAAEANDHVGELARVCGVVASARYVTSVQGQPTFLNLDRAYPRQVFTIVIWGKHRRAFGAPERALAGKSVCVTGTIIRYRGNAEIEARRPDQIVSLRAPAAF